MPKCAGGRGGVTVVLYRRASPCAGARFSAIAQSLHTRNSSLFLSYCSLRVPRMARLGSLGGAGGGACPFSALGEGGGAGCLPHRTYPVVKCALVAGSGMGADTLLAILSILKGWRSAPPSLSQVCLCAILIYLCFILSMKG